LAHSSLRLIGSRLYVIQGKPEEQIPLLVARWGVELLTFEKDTEPYAVLRDTSITKSLAKGVKVSSICSHTLYETEHYLATNGGKIPTTYVAFCKLFLSMSSMRQPIETITSTQVRSD
jgi:cryptochrome